jgi:hypothetical protein
VKKLFKKTSDLLPVSPQNLTRMLLAHFGAHRCDQSRQEVLEHAVGSIR